MDRRDQRQEKLTRHPLCSWLLSNEVPARNRLDILPALAPFVLPFRDLNRWVLRYPDPTTSLHTAINDHTTEDATHAELYIEDWRALGLDDRLGWSAADTMWWLFAAAHTRPIRNCLLVFAGIAAADQGDPMLRFAQSEAIEAGGNVFFRHTAPVAAELSAQTGVEYRYLGEYHLDRESGHVDTEDAFESAVLDAQQRASGLLLIDRVFDALETMFDAFYDYAIDHAGPGTPPHRDVEWAGDWDSLPWSASDTLKRCYLNHAMDPARYRLLARLSGERLPVPAPPRTAPDVPAMAKMASVVDAV